MTVDELAAAIRAYIGYPRTPANPDGETWYIDIDSGTSDEEIRRLAEDLIGEMSAVRSAVGESESGGDERIRTAE